MAKIELIEGTDTASMTISPDELLDIRKHALECVCRFAPRSRHQSHDIDYLLQVVKRFEEHLTRNIGNG